MNSESQKSRIYFIDDNPDMTLIYRKILSNRGFDTEFFLDHATALQTLKSSENPTPDLVFLDFMMPCGSAEEFLDKLEVLRPEFRDEFQLIIFSSLNENSPSLGSIASRCHGFREKPMSIEGLLSIIHSLLTKPEL